MRIIERKDAKYLLFGILEISEKKRENHSNSEKKHFERKDVNVNEFLSHTPANF